MIERLGAHALIGDLRHLHEQKRLWIQTLVRLAAQIRDVEDEINEIDEGALWALKIPDHEPLPDFQARPLARRLTPRRKIVA